jgi:tetratricopeptide (TPR) repeat protein
MRKSALLFILFILSCTQIKVANDFYKEGDYRKTVSTCKSILKTDSTKADVYYLLGRSYVHLGKTDSALYAFEKAVAVEPDNGKFREKYYGTLIEYGKTYMWDQPDSAIIYFGKAAQIDTTNPIAFEKKSDAYFALDKYEMAISGYHKSLALAGDTVRVQKKLAQIDSIATLAEAYLSKGMDALDQKKYEKAKQLFQAALDQNPALKQAKYQLYIATGLRLYKQGSDEALWDALDNFGRASLLFPEKGEPHYYSGLAYNKKDRNEYVNAIEAFEKAVAVEPDGEWAAEAQEQAEKIRALKKKMDEFWGR